MILTYKCEFGRPLPLKLAEKLTGNIEVECVEFTGALPVEWRFVTSDGKSLSDWKLGYREGVADGLRGFHDLQRPFRENSEVRTRGMSGADAILETRGIGSANFLVWPREGTFREKSSAMLGEISCTDE